jgi:isopenicillin N synthase-like dioxygenase
MSFAVPTVDISAFVSGGSDLARSEVATALDRACREVGFVQILGHGISQATIDGLTEAIDRFFELDLDEKKRYQTPPGINRGYSPPKSETLSLSLGVEAASKMNDFFESFNVGLTRADYPGEELLEVEYQDNVWPDGLPGFQAQVLDYFAEARRVATVLTSIFPCSLGLADDYFAQATSLATGTMRINNYALPPGSIDLDGELRGMGEHTDFGIVTVLWADQVRGLQVLGKDNGWHDVSPADNALLVNLGDVMARWTNDKWMSTLHRVKPPIIDGMIERRRSVAYFHGETPETIIAPIPELLESGETPRYGPVSAFEHSRAKLAGSRGGKKNDAVPRDAARVIDSSN